MQSRNSTSPILTALDSDTTTVKNKSQLAFEELDGMQSDQFLIIIGTGSHSKVYKGKYNSKPVAIKKLLEDETGYYPSQEASLLQLMHKAIVNENITNAGIVTFYGYALHNSLEYLVFELMYCSLDQWLIRKNNCLSLNYQLMGQVAEGLRFIHRFVVHCDLKPDNIYIEKNDTHTYARIGDFSYSRKINDTDTHKVQVGSLLYSAPELLRREVLNSEKTDIYSIGLILYYVATGIEAYHAFVNKKLFIRAVGFNSYPLCEYPIAERTSPKLMALTRWCIGAPDARPTATLLAAEFATSRNTLSNNLSLFTKDTSALQAKNAARQKTRALSPGCMI